MQDVANVTKASDTFTTDITAGTYAQNYVWHVLLSTNSSLMRSNINTTTNFISGSLTYSWVSYGSYLISLQYNQTDSNFYFITYDKKLYKVPYSDLEHYTSLATLTERILTFAINAQGEAYGIAENGNLYRINLNNGSLTAIGNTGVGSLAAYSQAMAFDNSTNELFWVAYTSTTANRGIYYVNTSNGQAKFIGYVGGDKLNMAALFNTASTSTPPQGIATAQANELSIYPNPAKDQLHVNGVEANTIIRIYDMTGKVVLQQNATENTIINVSELNRGVYVVSAGTSKVKFVKE